MDQEKLSKGIVEWLKGKVSSSGGEGGVFGLSGGIDSAVVAVLCKKAFGDRCMGLIMPCYSQDLDREHAELLAKKFAVPYKIITLDKVFDQMLFALGIETTETHKKNLAVSNIKPRLRMTTLYYFAAKERFRVIGTGNKSEIQIGYFTKYGDGGVDLEPLGDLLKEEVRELAGYLGVPQEIIDKEPTGGLWEGQTDENEMGFSYQELDRYLKGHKSGSDLDEKIEALIQRSEHKRSMPPVFELPRGDL